MCRYNDNTKDILSHNARIVFLALRLHGSPWSGKLRRKRQRKTGRNEVKRKKVQAFVWKRNETRARNQDKDENLRESNSQVCLPRSTYSSQSSPEDSEIHLKRKRNIVHRDKI